MTLMTLQKNKRPSRSARAPARRAGRPKLNKLRRQVKLPPEIDAYLRELGNGELSMGIERAARLVQRSSQTQSRDAQLDGLQERGGLSQRATAARALLASRAAHPPKLRHLQPLQVEGEPVSHMLIRERR